MKGNKWVNFRWVSKILGGIGKGGFLNKGNYHILFRNILKYVHKYIFFLTLVPQKIFFITIIANTL
jgi:hypothetical protein